MRASVVPFILLILGIVESKIQFASARLIPTSFNWISASHPRGRIAPRERMRQLAVIRSLDFSFVSPAGKV